MIANAGISRSGRVRKKSAKLIEMEDWDSGDGENYNKPRKKSKSFDDSDQDSERKVAPIRIPKPPFTLMSPQKKKSDNLTMNKILPMKIISRDGTPVEVKSSTSYGMNIPSMSTVLTPKMQVLSSTSSETSDSSSDESDSDNAFPRSPILPVNLQSHDMIKKKMSTGQNISKQMPAKKVEVKLNTFSGNEGSSEFTASLDESEDDTNDHSLIIAETPVSKKKKFISKGKRDNKEKAKNAKKSKISETEELIDATSLKKIEKKPKKKETKKKNESKPNRPMTAYMLWCSENRRKIVAQHSDMDFAQISKKMGEIWKLMPEKEKMAWKRKAKKAAHKGSMISTGRPNHSHPKFLSKTHTTNNNKLDEVRSPNHEGFRPVGTSSLDVAAHLKLLGESLSIIGQRLTEHEGQIAVSGSLSVLLDSTLCALGPLLCLTSQMPELNGCSQETLCHILDNIAYIMPGL
ncbi:HMG box-containing protein 4-like [Centruroides sculpturatus]|uniref:HMG box-containing protein 4-like n=1 Tax=Centruroides sculpturatus TaxID=218467 RepID=UPI000C6E6452|nr:HMG box-containing protein 4-like [Centruroides sculpturatus]XP_023227521.1 HMG box-containing protein 4-like [Centruroides sculpturatus]